MSRSARCSVFLIFCLVCLFASAPAAWSIAYELHDLGFPSGVTGGGWYGMSSTGMAAAMWSSSGIYAWNGGYTEVVSPGSGKSARDINRQLTVVGSRLSGDYRPAMWSAGTGPSGDITAFHIYGEATSINDRGLVTGYTYPSGGFNTGKRGFIYNPTGIGPANTEFGIIDVNGDSDTHLAFTVGYAINNNNVCTGVAIDGIYRQVYVWDETGGLRGIGPKTTNSIQPIDFSDSGIIVGSYGGGGGGFMLNEDGTGWKTLSQVANGVNSAGMVVSSYNMFYYEDTSYNISSLITNLNGYSMYGMLGINDLGLIFGVARRPDSSYAPIMLKPVVTDEAVAGGSCDSLGDWSTSATGTVNTTTDPNDAANSVIEMITGSPVSISQQVDTPNGDFLISFDYWFQTTTGTLDVMLDGQELLTLDAPSTVASDWNTDGLLVDNAALRNLQDVELTFILDDAGQPGDATVYVDNISLGLVNAAEPIPEPAALTLFALAAAGLVAGRRRRT